jgi:hypothetical protein
MKIIFYVLILLCCLKMLNGEYLLNEYDVILDDEVETLGNNFY